MVIYWHKHDYRLLDNPALTLAVQTALKSNMPLVVCMGLETDLISDAVTAYEYSEMVQSGVISAIVPLYKNYEHHGLTPLVFFEPILDFFARLHKISPVTQLFSHQEHGTNGTFARDKKVSNFCKLNGIKWVQLAPSGVIRNLASRDIRDRLVKDYIGGEILPIPNFKQLKQFTSNQELLFESQATLGKLETLHKDISVRYDLQPTSEKSALMTLKDFAQIRSRGYRGGISSPNTALIFGSRLSQFLAFGTISLRYIYQYLQKELKLSTDYKISSGITASIKRLYWREHFIQRLETDPNMPDHAINLEFDTIEYTHNPEYFEQFKNGTTGELLIDACIRCLNKTGFINFRMRAMIVSYATFGLDLDWRIYGRFLATLFLDYEPGIHWSQVQMQAGVTGINTIRVYSPYKQLLDQDPEYIFVRKWIPELEGVSNEQLLDYPNTDLNILTNGKYPNPVVDFKQASKINKLKTFGVRKSASKDIAKKVYIKHGSRKPRISKRKIKPDNVIL